MATLAPLPSVGLGKYLATVLCFKLFIKMIFPVLFHQNRESLSVFSMNSFSSIALTRQLTIPT